PRVPIIVGGNGRRVTFRLAARFADELNLVYLDPAATAEAMAVARERCEEVGRDPATLRLSLYAPDRHFAAAGQERVDALARYAEVGLDRIIAFLGRGSVDPEVQAAFAEDVRAAGLTLRAAETAAA
ncbi:MAG: LLM class F420-dependent oxidoreductase, partial [Chloroflexi bacterium]|nr:LLM class F420-dependent oxidoreductase [Chloroflexota bacterium]